MTGASVHSAQGMISAFGPWHDSIGKVAQGHEAFKEAGRYERHVTGDEDDAVVARRGQRGVEAAQRAAVRHPVRHLPDPGDFLRPMAAHEKDIVGQPAKLIELTLEDAPAADAQRALVATAEATRLPASENRGACHGFSILPLAEYA